MELKARQKRLSGVKAFELLLKGHAVRRSEWVDNYLIRITNEAGFKKNGFFQQVSYMLGKQKRTTPVYVQSTEGYFFHFGTANQPLRYAYSPTSDGFQMFVENDWEDYGFMTDMRFDELIKKYRHEISNERRKIRNAFLERGE